MRTLLRSAELLERAAEFLRSGFSAGGEWLEDPAAQEAKAEWEEMLQQATDLRMLRLRLSDALSAPESAEVPPPRRTSGGSVDLDELRRLSRELTQKQLAEHFGVSAPTISYYCKRYGVRPVVGKRGRAAHD